MRRLPFLFIFVVLLVCGTAFAQTPDGETPANEGVCDELMADGVTKGLYGLCVAFCEAQDCEATYDPATEEVTFGPDCRPSNPKLLDNYNRRKSPGDPPMPCVNVIETECPCWTDAEIAIPFAAVSPFCWFYPPTSGAFLMGFGPVSGGDQGAGTDTYWGDPFGCVFTNFDQVPRVTRLLDISLEDSQICVQSIVDECASRSLLP